MMRDPDLDQALIDLRPVYAELQRTERDLKKDEVRNNLNVWGSVDRRCRDLRSDIGSRAERIIAHSIAAGTARFRVMMALLGTDAIERKRLGRRASATQITAALQRNVKRYEALVEEHDAKAATAAQIAASTRERLEAHRGACILYTGYAN